MHQLVKFHKYTDKKGKIVSSSEWLPVKFSDLDAFFDDPEKVLAPIPKETRENPYYTLAKRQEGDRSVAGFIRQDHIAFDIDDIDTTKEEATARVAIEALGLKWEDTIVVASGHGVQFLIRLTQGIEDPLFFETHKVYYNGCCMKIDAALKVAGLQGHADVKIFDHARVLRPPNTWNVKPGKEKKWARTLQTHVKPVQFDLKAAAGIPDVPPEDAIGMSFPEPDTEAVLEGCEFLKWTVENQDQVSEPQWYAMASIVGRLKDGGALFHKFSEKYKGYSRLETEKKLEQALQNSGPRTCKSIDQEWSKCHTCKFYNKLKSPILIHGPNYIKTKDSGFRHVKFDPVTRAITGMSGIDIEDLVKYFEQTYPYKVDAADETAYQFNGQHYVEIPPLDISGFAEKWADKARNRDVNEFKAKVLRRNLAPKGFFRELTDGYMNFLNGYLNVKTMEFSPPSPDMGFRSVLPYEYDANAKAPRFEKFLDEITCGNEGYKKTLLEFSGYALSNDRYWDHKALLLIGHGSNGKSTFVQTLCSLAEGSFSGVKPSQFGNDQQIAKLDGKLFNISEETSDGGFKESDSFKLLASGGLVSAKVVYKQAFDFFNKAKIIVLLNKPPWSEDTSHGFLRRCAFVSFDAKFTGENMDPFLTDKLLVERPGILNLMLSAYREMLKRGRCYMDEKSDQFLETFKKESNPAILWMDDNFVQTKNPADFVASKDMYANYVSFCEACGYRPLTMIRFIKELKAQNNILEESRQGHNRLRGFKYVRLLSDALKPNLDTDNL